MAFDGVVISNIVNELKETVVGGRIYKIYQPETDELNIVIKNNRENHRLLLSASASLPLVYLTTNNKDNPLTAPNFCMLLRKHIGNGRVVEVYQPNFERIIVLEIEHLDELGDLCRKKLIIELMGKHSNIIFTDNKDMIIDSIKHISAQISSVREVLPGRDYIIPPNKDKINPLDLNKDYFENFIITKPLNICKAIYSSIIGFSPLIANEICYRAGVEADRPTESIDDILKDNLYNQMLKFILEITDKKYMPNIIYSEGIPIEFSSVVLDSYSDNECVIFQSISQVLEKYYKDKETVTRIRQKSSDLRRVVSTCIERTSKKYDLQVKQLKDTEKRDKYKIYGELINIYGYNLKAEDKQLLAINYYNNEEVSIPIDNTLTPTENANKYFAKYNKLKRTYEALIELTEESKSELDHLLSVQNSLDIAIYENDLSEIKEELIQAGYVKAKYTKGKKIRSVKSKPFHYISSDGFHMYVGKNNLQNDELTFKFANGNDMWFHAKQMPGSHVIVKLEGEKELPDKTYEEAARLAAYYSAGKSAPKVEVDYTKRSNLKKPPAAKPGFVIYHTNYSMNIEPSIEEIKEL